MHFSHCTRDFNLCNIPQISGLCTSLNCWSMLGQMLQAHDQMVFVLSGLLLRFYYLLACFSKSCFVAADRFCWHGFFVVWEFPMHKAACRAECRCQSSEFVRFSFELVKSIEEEGGRGSAMSRANVAGKPGRPDSILQPAGIQRRGHSCLYCSSERILSMYRRACSTWG